MITNHVVGFVLYVIHWYRGYASEFQLALAKVAFVEDEAQGEAGSLEAVRVELCTVGQLVVNTIGYLDYKQSFTN